MLAWRYIGLVLLLQCLFWSSSLLAAEREQVTLPRFPSLSPDGGTIVFSWHGNLWRVPVTGGDAQPLTRHRFDDLHSSWSPDGQWLVFTSMRDGYLNLWRMRPDGSGLSQLTHSDRHIRHPAYQQDTNGTQVILFSSLLEADVYRDERAYVIGESGGEPRRLHDAFGSEPRLSPDGQRLLFTRGGYYHGWHRRGYRGPDSMNVWLHDRRTGTYEALTERTGDDGSARWLNDEQILFLSDRSTGRVNLYRKDLSSDIDEAVPLTAFEDRDVQSYDVSLDGRIAIVHVWDRLYRLDLSEAESAPVALSIRASDDAHDEYQLLRIDREVTEAQMSPDGQVMAYVAHGRIYVRHMEQHSVARSVTPETHARHRDLQWAPDGTRLYFVSDADGTESIYEARVRLTRRELAEQSGQPSAASTEITFASDDSAQESAPLQPMIANQAGPPGGDRGVYVAAEDPEDPFAPVDPGLPAEPPIDPEPAAPPLLVEPLPLVPTAPVVTEEPSEPAPQAEPKRPRSGPLDPSRWHDAVRFSVHPVVQSRYNDRSVSPSPDGRQLAFRRGRGDLMVLDLRNGRERQLVAGWDSNLHWRWSPDSRYIAYVQNDLNFSANIFLVPADASHAPVNVTRHPRNDLNPRWSADGRKLTFLSNRSGNSYDVYRVYLDPELARYGERQRHTYYREARERAQRARPLPVDRAAEQNSAAFRLTAADLESAWRRTAAVTSHPANQSQNEMTPGGDRYLFNAGAEGLVIMNWDGSERRRLGSAANVQHVNLTGDRAVYINSGRVGVINLSNGNHQHPDISDQIRIDLREQALQKYREVSRVIREGFYRDDMKGLDWDALVADYEVLIRSARTSSEFSDIVNRLLGELSASHTGISNPGLASGLRQPSGRLGVDYQPVALSGGQLGFRVTSVLPGGPAEQADAIRLQEGDIITEVESRPFFSNDTLQERLRGTVGQEVLMSFVRREGRRSVEYQSLITPIDYAGMARLKYDAFRAESEALVHELSAGRIGYIHIQAMNQASLEAFQSDLYAAAFGREGLIIDVRNNGGGHTTDRILTSIMAPDHAYTLPAGADPTLTGHYPQDRLDAPRYTLKMNMLVNEKSYSNAEILAHAFSTLDRGTLVGQQTYGGVISTGSYPLVDGATVRRPFRGWYLQDGTDMEHQGAVPDLLVPQRPEDEVAGRDRQLERAVEDLLSRLDD
jgi:tricorn protease